MPLKSESEDAIILAAVNMIASMLEGTMVALVLCTPDGQPFFLPHPDLDLESVRTVFRALGDGRYNTSKSL